MRTDISYNVINSLKMLETNRLNQLELRSFAEFCCNVSYSCVSKRKKTLDRLTVKYGTTLQDIATNALIPLFSRNESDEFYILKNAYKNWYPAIETQNDAIDFLNKIIDHRVQQQIATFLKENDPLFAKLHTYILNLSKKESLVKKVYKGTSYLVRRGEKNLSGNFIDYNNFQLFPASLFSEDETMLKNILAYLKRETNFAQAIPLNLLVRRLKALRQNDFELYSGSTHTHSQMVINELVQSGLEQALRKLDSVYIEKGKFTRSEAEAFHSALKDIAEDLKEGGIYPGLFDYLQTHIPSLTKATYKEKYHNSLEYLYKIIRLSIAAQLQN